VKVKEQPSDDFGWWLLDAPPLSEDNFESEWEDCMSELSMPCAESNPERKWELTPSRPGSSIWQQAMLITRGLEV